ncbi:protein-tyrosine phosphatase-like protein [Ochromonadaceae sp. CCMP2298]|nr:protein-tyrosine phosphatase-like protein [Ochromonadaceae sp. CCMP2298]|mmetsp:Transcript_19084/g.42573  ORF Transcript_19084/g.42573 Transcript_19084/m.42573 type:complete len:436 (+) Transcript_19084:122-1429(+)
MIRHEDIDDGPLTSRMHKVCCCTSCCCACNSLWQPCRKAVSGKKQRIRKDGFDLDMAYVSPRIIVHGFPAAGLEHMYRNPRAEIRRFMDTYHQDHYKVYNFCCEFGRGYDPAIFHGRVERYPFKDHNTPPLETMAAYANSVKNWLDEDTTNVVNMHCKAGKGRAGLMCCVALIRTGVAQSAKEALEIYDRKRVTNNKGLTVVSQRKFVIFYEKLWREHWGVSGNIGDVPAEPLDSTKFVVPPQPAMRLLGIEVLNLPEGLINSVRVKIFKISNFLPVCVYDSKVMKCTSITLDVDVVLQGNFKIAISFKNGGFLSSHIKLMELLHNTLFMDKNADSIDFGMKELDTKKKISPKMGTAALMRLRFTQDMSGAAGDASGYALVGGESAEEGVEITEKQSAARAAGEFTSIVAAKKVGSTPTGTTESAGSAGSASGLV